MRWCDIESGDALNEASPKRYQARYHILLQVFIEFEYYMQPVLYNFTFRRNMI